MTACTHKECLIVDAISTEREQVLGSHNFKDMTPEQQEDFVECEKNIAFATIGSFSIYTYGHSITHSYSQRTAC